MATPRRPPPRVSILPSTPCSTSGFKTVVSLQVPVSSSDVHGWWGTDCIRTIFTIYSTDVPPTLRQETCLPHQVPLHCPCKIGQQSISAKRREKRDSTFEKCLKYLISDIQRQWHDQCVAEHNCDLNPRRGSACCWFKMQKICIFYPKKFQSCLC